MFGRDFFPIRPGEPLESATPVWWWLIPVALVADCLHWSFTMVVVVILVWKRLESWLFSPR